MHPIQRRLVQLAAEKNLPPLSLRGIGKLISEDSAQKVKHHLGQLERKGLLVYNRTTKTLRATKKKGTRGANLVPVPIFGAANAGPSTLFATENLEGYLKISAKLLPKRNIFAIRAEGNSMNRASIDGKNIEDGDYVIIDPQARTPQNGEYVLSVIDDVANIKRYYFEKENNQVMLISESTQKYPPDYY